VNDDQNSIFKYWLFIASLNPVVCKLGVHGGLVELNAAGAQWAIPTGIERGISVLNRILLL
jgi:hypothetical protein